MILLVVSSCRSLLRSEVWDSSISYPCFIRANQWLKKLPKWILPRQAVHGFFICENLCPSVALSQPFAPANLRRVGSEFPAENARAAGKRRRSLRLIAYAAG